ncbi:MAG: hypothetical protein ACFFCM_02490 [Promethearchaeota archaeon]
MELILKSMEEKPVVEKVKYRNILLDLIYLYSTIEQEKLEHAKKYPVKGSRCTKRRVPSLAPVEALLNRMQYVDEKINYLRAYIDGLERSRETIYSQRSLPNIIGQEDYRAQMSVYLQVYPELLKLARNKLRELEDERYENKTLIHKF